MALLAGRILRQQPCGCRHALLVGAALGSTNSSAVQRVHGELAQPLALDQRPFLERRCVCDRDAAEEVAAIERQCIA